MIRKLWVITKFSVFTWLADQELNRLRARAFAKARVIAAISDKAKRPVSARSAITDMIGTHSVYIFRRGSRRCEYTVFLFWGFGVFFCSKSVPSQVIIGSRHIDKICCVCLKCLFSHVLSQLHHNNKSSWEEFVLKDLAKVSYGTRLVIQSIECHWDHCTLLSPHSYASYHSVGFAYTIRCLHSDD